jgi:hypothetical protein
LRALFPLLAAYFDGRSVTFLKWLFRNTFNNVAFGIALMILIGGYIAIGSGVPAVREFFEMNELEFFDAWPLKLLMLLLCLSLATVTFNRIPLTPPRYGVWCIHAGIILLISGTSLYYHFKLEGRTMIPLNHTVNIFYDSAERALYARVPNSDIYGTHPLPSLPRFGEYDADHDASRLNRSDLQDISHMAAIANSADGAPMELSQWLGVDQPVTLGFVGYYSYADVVQNVITDPSANSVGVEVKLESQQQGDSQGALLRLTASDPTSSHQFFGNAEFEYRQVSETSLAEISKEANALFELRISLPGREPKTVAAGIGVPVKIDGGYTVTLESYNPAFPMFGTHELVQTLTLHVVSDSPKREFWRMILAGRDLQTDFKMDLATTPPMVKGNRQKEPIDKNLVLNFRVNDPSALIPTASAEKHVFLTAGDHTLEDIHTTFGSPAQILDLSEGGRIDVPTDSAEMTGLVRRIDHFRLVSSVVTTPEERRIKDQAEAGVKQVAVVRVTCGNWSEDVCVPTDLDAAPDPQVGEPMVPWNMGVVQIPGAKAPLQLQLGYVCRPLPATVALRNFEMIHYAGGQGPNGPFRDFRSTLEITGLDGMTQVAVASLNEPVYFEGGKWIFFQAGYDPDGQFSTIGVGNRPGVYIMVTGCGMIVLGLMYAFYAKPMVIRRMKASALARAARISTRRIPSAAKVEVS